jgi:hypothetical protein
LQSLGQSHTRFASKGCQCWISFSNRTPSRQPLISSKQCASSDTSQTYL